ncbi:hypothetical protein [Pseudomonas sp. RC10]
MWADLLLALLARGLRENQVYDSGWVAVVAGAGLYLYLPRYL